MSSSTSRSTKSKSSQKISKTEARKHEKAKELERLSGRWLHVSFEPKRYHTNDEAAKGHVFDAFANTGKLDDYLVLDDRLDASLEEQLARECRRVADVYSDLARRIEKKIRKNPFAVAQV